MIKTNSTVMSFLTQALQQMPRLFTAEASSHYLLSYYEFNKTY